MNKYLSIETGERYDHFRKRKQDLREYSSAQQNKNQTALT